MSEHEHTHDCGCGCEGCGHDCQEEHDTVTLVLEDDSELECGILGIFPVGEQQYIALTPLEQSSEEDPDVYIYRYATDEDGNPHLSNIEGDEEYEAVSDAFDELLDTEEFNTVFNEDEDEEEE